MYNYKKPVKSIILLTAVFLLLFASCGKRKEPAKKTPSFPVQVKNIKIYSQPDSIISMSDKVTETLISLGLGDQIIAVNSGCSVEGKQELPQVGTSAYIDTEAVRQLNPELVVSVFPLSGDTLKALSETGTQVLILNEDDDYDEILKRLKGNPEADK